MINKIYCFSGVRLQNGLKPTASNIFNAAATLAAPIEKNSRRYLTRVSRNAS